MRKASNDDIIQLLNQEAVDEFDHKREEIRVQARQQFQKVQN